MKWILRSFGWGLVVSALFTTLIAPAEAATLGPNAPTNSKLTAGMNAPASNPYNCYGRSDYPHESITNPGNAVAKGWTICPGVTPPYMFVYSELTRDRWYGEEFLAEKQSTSKFNCSYGKCVEVIPKWWCSGTGTYTYHIYSHHEIHGGDGAIYDLDTSNTNRFDC
jgi:hypothetical protein